VDLSPPSVCAYGAIAGCACAGQGRRRSLFLFPLVSVWVTPPRVTCARRCRPAGLALRATVVWRAIVGWRPWCAAASGGRRRTGYARGPRRQTGAGPARGWVGGRQASRCSDSRGGRFALALGGGARGHRRNSLPFLFDFPAATAVRVHQRGIRSGELVALLRTRGSFDTDITLFSYKAPLARPAGCDHGRRGLAAVDAC
jgi:hypothetical protein